MDHDTKGTDSIEMQVVLCMRDLLRPLPDLRNQYSSRVIVLAFLTHASAGIQELLARGEYTPAEVEVICEDFCSRVRSRQASSSSANLDARYG